MAETLTWEVWDSMQSVRRGEGRGATPAEAYGDFAKAWDAEGLGTPDCSVNLRHTSGEWWVFGGAVWQRTPDRAAVRAAEASAMVITDRYGLITADPNPSPEELRRRQGIQWWVDRQLIAEGLERLCRCIVHPECAGRADIARACWADSGPRRYDTFERRAAEQTERDKDHLAFLRSLG